MSGQSESMRGIHTTLVPMSFDGPLGFLTADFDWSQLSQDTNLEEKLAFFMVTTSEKWEELDKTNYFSLLKEKCSSIKTSQLEDSWKFFEIFKESRTHGIF